MKDLRLYLCLKDIAFSPLDRVKIRGPIGRTVISQRLQAVTEHARDRCVFGACEIIACDYGFVDCDGDADDGCERLITNAGCEQNVVTGLDADAGGA